MPCLPRLQFFYAYLQTMPTHSSRNYLEVRNIIQTFMRRNDVESATGLPTSTIYELMSKGQFPRPVRLGQKSVAWLNLKSWRGSAAGSRRATALVQQRNWEMTTAPEPPFVRRAEPGLIMDVLESILNLRCHNQFRKSVVFTQLFLITPRAAGRSFPASRATKFRQRRGFKDATTNPATLRRWWRGDINYNVGIATGLITPLGPRHRW